METPETNSYIIYVAQNAEGQWFSNLDATDGIKSLSPSKQIVGHGVTLRDATLDLLDQWKNDIIKQRNQRKPVAGERD